LAILYTPIKNYLPGYTENIRQQLIIESARVDSLGTSLELQRQYLNIIKQVMAGEAQSDTVQPLDSMQIIMREQLLEAKSEATAEFMAQYEEKEKDNMHLFTGTNYMETPVTAFFRPVMGNVTQHFSSQQGQLSITISTTNEASVAAVLDGVVLFVNHDVNNRYSIIIQHANYTSIYRQLKLVNKRVGDRVKIGENIGIANTTVSFQLWEDGSAIDPEKFIAF
jgi:murein DD-endopeptidase MepM/ murein hydrolase activator NlpD